jgi:hypothetical protein
MKRDQRGTPGNMKPNYLHLDMKGIIPLYPRILDWRRLGLRHLQLRQATVTRSMNFTMLEATHRFLAAEPDYVNHFRRGAQVERSRLDAFFNDVTAYFADRQLSGAEEFVQGRQAALAAMLRLDWAENLMPRLPPRTAR